jgi:hypothetical protein
MSHDLSPGRDLKNKIVFEKRNEQMEMEHENKTRRRKGHICPI